MGDRLTLVMLCALVVACNPADRPLDLASLEFVGMDGNVIKSIHVEIAEDPAARQRGLMDRRQLTLDEGMLFVFPAPDSQSFWMKNTPLSLDIMFIRSDSSIANIVKRTLPLSEDFIRSTDLAQYVVEVRGGFSDRFGIDETARVRWRRQ